MKIIIIVPDGVGVRNYLYSNFIDILISSGHKILFYHKLSKSALDEIKLHKPELDNFVEIPNFIEYPLTRLLRESLVYARLLVNKRKLKNDSILKFWSPSKKGYKKKILYFLAEFLGTIFSGSYNLIKFLDTYYNNIVAQTDITQQINIVFSEFNPDLLLNLHQRSIITPPIISLANSLNITTSTVIFSWDNVPKARLISRYNYYFVWSDLMSKELKKLYPEIHKEQIKLVGTPQFEFYFNNKYIEEKEAFFSKFGLNPSIKTICFSGNDLSSPYEAVYLNDLCEKLSTIEIINRPQILFRKSPVDHSKRFDEILETYKDFLFVIDPDWKTEKKGDDTFTSIYPAYNDISLLVNTIKHSDVIVNLGSTMAHDAAVLDIPCLYFNYNPVSNPIFKVEDVYDFQHFNSLKDIEAVGWINSKEEIIEKVFLAIDSPKIVGGQRKDWLERIVLHPLEKNSNLLAKTITKEIIS